MKNWFRNAAVAVVLGGSLLAVGAAPAQAADRCEQRVRKAEENLNKAIRKHGDRSRQAQDKRRDLERERAGCRRDNGRHDDHNEHHFRQ